MAHASAAWFWARPGPRTRLATLNSVGGGLSRRLVGAFRSPLCRKKTRERKEGSQREREREREKERETYTEESRWGQMGSRACVPPLLIMRLHDSIWHRAICMAIKIPGPFKGHSYHQTRNRVCATCLFFIPSHASYTTDRSFPSKGHVWGSLVGEHRAITPFRSLLPFYWTFRL